MNIFQKEGLLLAIVPLLGYMLAYIYELSYANRMGLPDDLIYISIEMILYSTILLIVFFSTTAALFFLLQKYTNFLDDAYKKWIFIQILLISIYIIVFSFLIMFLIEAHFGIDIPEWLEMLIISSIICAMTFFKLFHEREKAKVMMNFKPGITQLNVMFLLYIFALLFLASYFGATNANNRSMFYINKENEGYLIVQLYNDTLISRGYDFEQERFTDEIIIEKISDEPLVLEWIEVHRKDIYN